MLVRNVVAHFFLSTILINMNTFVYWAPRVLSILFIGFVSLFALDVFSEYQGRELVVPFIMHMLPSIALTIAVVIAWRYELVGSALFIGFAAWYVWEAGLDKPWSWYAAIAGPAAIVGLLYLASWYLRGQGAAHESASV